MIPKFRAWHKELKAMFKVYSLEWYADTERLSAITLMGPEIMFLGDMGKRSYYECDGSLGAIELMQFTGIQDKCGVDIYAGDIIEYYADSDTFVGYVKEWITPCDGYHITPIKEHEKKWPLQWTISVRACQLHGKVIGNVYENPGLMR